MATERVRFSVYEELVRDSSIKEHKDNDDYEGIMRRTVERRRERRRSARRPRPQEGAEAALFGGGGYDVFPMLGRRITDCQSQLVILGQFGDGLVVFHTLWRDEAVECSLSVGTGFSLPASGYQAGGPLPLPEPIVALRSARCPFCGTRSAVLSSRQRRRAGHAGNQ